MGVITLNSSTAPISPSHPRLGTHSISIGRTVTIDLPHTEHHQQQQDDSPTPQHPTPTTHQHLPRKFHTHLITRRSTHHPTSLDKVKKPSEGKKQTELNGAAIPKTPPPRNTPLLVTPIIGTSSPLHPLWMETTHYGHQVATTKRDLHSPTPTNTRATEHPLTTHKTNIKTETKLQTPTPQQPHSRNYASHNTAPEPAPSTQQRIRTPKPTQTPNLRPLLTKLAPSLPEEHQNASWGSGRMGAPGKEYGSQTGRALAGEQEPFPLPRSTIADASLPTSTPSRNLRLTLQLHHRPSKSGTIYRRIGKITS